MKLAIAASLIGACVLLGACAKKKAAADSVNIRSVGAQEFNTLLNAKDPKTVLIDIRTPQEYAEGHIAGSLNMDFYAADFKAHLAALDHAKTYLMYCRSGNRTRQAAALADTLGLTLVVLERGIHEWVSNNLPLEK